MNYNYNLHRSTSNILYMMSLQELTYGFIDRRSDYRHIYIGIYQNSFCESCSLIIGWK